MKIKVDAFARSRHIPGKPYSEFVGTFESLEFLLSKNLKKEALEAGYRPGVFLFKVDPFSVDNFLVGHKAIEVGDKLVATFEPRQNGEAPMKGTYIKQYKPVAQACVLVFYTPEVLAENDDNLEYRSVDKADLYLISINAGMTEAECRDRPPMDPITMARNQLGLAGGTQASYTSDEWAKAVWYDATHANVMGA